MTRKNLKGYLGQTLENARNQDRETYLGGEQFDGRAEIADVFSTYARESLSKRLDRVQDILGKYNDARLNQYAVSFAEGLLHEGILRNREYSAGVIDAFKKKSLGSVLEYVPQSTVTSVASDNPLHYQTHIVMNSEVKPSGKVSKIIYPSSRKRTPMRSLRNVAAALAMGALGFAGLSSLPNCAPQQNYAVEQSGFVAQEREQEKNYSAAPLVYERTPFVNLQDNPVTRYDDEVAQLLNAVRNEERVVESPYTSASVEAPLRDSAREIVVAHSHSIPVREYAANLMNSMREVGSAIIGKTKNAMVNYMSRAPAVEVVNEPAIEIPETSAPVETRTLSAPSLLEQVLTRNTSEGDGFRPLTMNDGVIVRANEDGIPIRYTDPKAITIPVIAQERHSDGSINQYVTNLFQAGNSLYTSSPSEVSIMPLDREDIMDLAHSTDPHFIPVFGWNTRDNKMDVITNAGSYADATTGVFLAAPGSDLSLISSLTGHEAQPDGMFLPKDYNPSDYVVAQRTDGANAGFGLVDFLGDGSATSWYARGIADGDGEIVEEIKNVMKKRGIGMVTTKHKPAHIYTFVRSPMTHTLLSSDLHDYLRNQDSRVASR